MPTVDLYPTGTVTGQWTPSTPGPDHHLLVDDVYPPGDNTDYVQVLGFSGGFLERFSFGAGPANIGRVNFIELELYFEGVDAATVAASRAELFVNGVKRGISIEVLMHSGSGVWDTALFLFETLNIPGTEWRAGSIEILLTPLDGSAGFVPYTPGID